jgi:ribosome biogenesis GTPase / thiamine phosphate phosphatase
MTLSALGWDDFFSTSFAPFAAAGLVPARVACEHKHAYNLYSTSGELTAGCTGRLLHDATTRADLPAVGDWVAVAPRRGEMRADIHAVLPRRTKFSRRAAGSRPDEQIVAANVDTVFLVSALDANYNLRRIERFLAVAWESGAQPVVVLNKADLHRSPQQARAEVLSLSGGAPVLLANALAHEGLDTIAAYAKPGRTLAFLGSSGVGKSTLINVLLGESRQETGAARADDSRGRHTTTRRELLLAAFGALIMDTPGMRELQFHADDVDVDETFDDVVGLAAQCRFSDCRHNGEPGCAIEAALADGTLDEARWASYQKLAREQAYLERKANPLAARARKAVWKKIHANQRARQSWDDRNEDG